MTTFESSFNSYVEAVLFDEPRLQPADSDWQGQCVIRLTITTTDSPDASYREGTYSESWLVEQPSNPTKEPRRTDLSAQEPYIWSSYRLAANWIGRQSKTRVDKKYELVHKDTYLICRYPLEC